MRISWIVQNVLAASGTPITDEDITALHGQGIRAIVTLTEHPLTIRRTITDELFTRLDIRTLHSPIPDGFAPSRAQAQVIVDFIDNMTAAGRPALVHCQAGIGRTGTLLHAYFVLRGHTLEDARDKIRLARMASSYLNLTAVQQDLLLALEKARR